MAARRISIAALIDQPQSHPNPSPIAPTPSASTAPAPPTPILAEHSQHSTNPSPLSAHPQTISWALNKPQPPPPPSGDITFSAYRVPAPPLPHINPSQEPVIEYEAQYSPSNRQDVSVFPTNTPISFEFYNPSEPKKTSSKKRGSVAQGGGGTSKGSKATSSNNTGSHRRGASSAKSKDLDHPPPSIGDLSAVRDKSAGLSPDTLLSGTTTSTMMGKLPGDTDAVMSTAEDLNRVSLGGGTAATTATAGKPRAVVAATAQVKANMNMNTHANVHAQAQQIPLETTVEDDIMADLDEAERAGGASTSGMLEPVSRERSTTKDVDSEMDLEMEILGEATTTLGTGAGGVGTNNNTLVVPAVPKRLTTPSSATSGSPAPSSSLLAVPTASKPAKKSGASKSSAAKPKTKAGAAGAAGGAGGASGGGGTTKSTKKKADTKKGDNAKGKQKAEGDFAWGTSSGRAAAAAAASALLMGGGYDEGLDARRGTDTPPVGGAGGRNWEPDAGEEEGEEEEDKRLYCVCRELYDNRFMVGCDNCDEWYHPPCLGMQDFECDLLEHFYCDNCRKADPSLRTTWRTRCSNGMQHPYPDSGEACWRAALPPLSKYCSKECGIQAIERKIAPFIAAKTRTTYDPDQLIQLTPPVIAEMNRLYEGVKHAKRRQAAVVEIHAPSATPANSTQEIARLGHSYETLSTTLFELNQQAQVLSRELGFVLARGRLAELAIQWSEKSENLSRCGFDSRLLIEGRQWEEWVEGEGKVILEAGIFDDAAASNKRSTSQQRLGDELGEKPADGSVTPGEEEDGDMADSPWCDGRRKCERHFGWQKLYFSEYELNKGTKELAIQRLLNKQKDVQTRMENTQQRLQTLHGTNHSEPVSAS